MALGLTQPLTEMSTRNISYGGKGGRRVGLTILPPSCADCLEILEPQTPGTPPGTRPRRYSIPDRPAHSSVAIPTELRAVR